MWNREGAARGDSTVNVKLKVIGLALLAAVTATAAPLPRDPDARPDVSAPVSYQDLMLVLVTKDGAAAVVFESPSADGSEVEYSFRFESADGKKKSSGTGKLFERRQGGPNGNYDRRGNTSCMGRGTRYLCYSYTK